VRLVTYDYAEVEKMDDAAVTLWKDAFTPCDVIGMTVHPPRVNGELNNYGDGFFHVSTLVGKVIAAGGLQATLLAKTGSIVKEYRREFYVQGGQQTCPCLDHADTDQLEGCGDHRLHARYLVNEYKIPTDCASLCSSWHRREAVLLAAGAQGRGPDALSHAQRRFPSLWVRGRVREAQGSGLLVDAFAKVVKDFPKAHLTLVGKNGRDIEGELQAAVKAAGLESNVSFYPFTEEPMYVYEAIDCVVVSSLMKGLSNVQPEGLAMKKPCVSTNIAGCPECWMDGVDGFLCEPS
jgi:glycosyltransferase involved in cell wall biosynthesis